VEKFFRRDNGLSIFIGGGVLWLVYALLTVFIHQSNTYQLSTIQLLLLQLTIIVPVLLIWLVALYGAVRFKQYAYLIKGSPDGRALDLVTTGLLVLILSFIAQSILGSLRWYALGTPWLSPMILLNNHLPIALSLVAVVYMYAGSVRLNKVAKTVLSGVQLPAVLLPFTVFSALFSAYFYTHINHATINGLPNFALPGAAPFYTMALPYLVVWMLGLLAIMNMVNYIRHSKGAIYRRSLRDLVWGIMAVIGFTILVQLLTLASTALAKLRLGPLLLVIYLLLIFYSLGFVLIAVGAKRLTRLEVAQ